MNTQIIIITHNNLVYLKMMIKQLEGYDLKNIVILDSKSTDLNMIKFLKNTIYRTIILNENTGPHSFYKSEIYDQLDDIFIVTDPDLLFNEHLPKNFVEILIELSNKYKCSKIGPALDISDYDKMFQYNDYSRNMNIQQWESQMWVKKIEDSKYELYETGIDTTFFLHNKKFGWGGLEIRIAGNFTFKHLPWYIENWHKKDLPLLYRWNMYKENSRFSTTGKFITRYLEEKNILRINKNNIENLVFGNTSNRNFWLDNYNKDWKNKSFEVLDKYLDKNKDFLDIGGWIGTTCLYASQKSKKVVVVECDPKSVEELEKNIKLNSHNITLINRAIYNKETEIIFGKNKFLSNSKFNDSTSQIKIEKMDETDIIVKTITLSQIIEDNNLNLSLIKINIEGGEQYIIDDIFEILDNYKIPIYLGIRYNWWDDKNLEKYPRLQPYYEYIKSNPFCDILITNLD